MNINKDEFVQQLIDKYNYTKTSATALVDDFWSVLIDNIASGNTVSFYGYGCFDIVLRKERTVKAPRSGDSCVIPEHWVTKFYPGNTIKRAVKKWEDSSRRGLI